MKNSINKPTVYIIDDDLGVRKSLHWLLESVNMDCLMFSDANEFLAVFNNSLRGCIVLDIRMPGMSGLELQRHLNDSGAHLPVIIVTAHADVPIALQAMKAGAYDLVEKPYSDELLLEIIRAAIELDSSTEETLQRHNETRQKLDRLTTREYEVMTYIVDGYQNKEVADRLCISVKTVEAHRSSLMKKLQAHSLSELIRMVLSVQDNHS